MRNCQLLTVNCQLSRGFTLIELMVVMGIFALMLGFASINLLRPQTQASLDTTVKTLVSDIRVQQIKAMAGDTQDTGSALDHGIYLESNRYTLFRGAYNPTEPSNFIINLETGLQLTTTLPSSQIVFSKRSGEISGFVAGQNTITLQNTQSAEQKIITINRYGAVTIN